MKHFIFIEQMEDESPSPYYVTAEDLKEAIHLFAEGFIDPDEAWDDLDAQGIDPSVFSKEELLIMGLRSYVDYITAYEVKSDYPETPDCWCTSNITTDFQDILLHHLC